jgi:hypothetical protein
MDKTDVLCGIRKHGLTVICSSFYAGQYTHKLIILQMFIHYYLRVVLSSFTHVQEAFT